MRNIFRSLVFIIIVVSASLTSAAEKGDIIAITEMIISDSSGEQVKSWPAGGKLEATSRFNLGGDESVKIIVRVAMEFENEFGVSWNKVIEEFLDPGEHVASFSFEVPKGKIRKKGRLIWSVKGRYYVPGKLLPWVLSHHESQPLEFNDQSIREIRANPSLSASTRNWVWVRNRQGTPFYQIVP